MTNPWWQCQETDASLLCVHQSQKIWVATPKEALLILALDEEPFEVVRLQVGSRRGLQHTSIPALAKAATLKKVCEDL